MSLIIGLFLSKKLAPHMTSPIKNIQNCATGHILRDGQLFSSVPPSPGDYLLAPHCAHTLQKSMSPGAFTSFWLVCSLRHTIVKLCLRRLNVFSVYQKIDGSQF